MKKILKTFLFITILFVTLFIRVNAETLISEVRIEGDRRFINVGELGPISVTTSTEGLTIDDSNTNWSKWEAGYSSWHGFGSETPTAVASDTTYAMSIALELESGYAFADSVNIYYNDTLYNAEGHTLLDSGFTWGGYLYLDLGTAHAPLTVTFISNNGLNERDTREVDYGASITLGPPRAYGFTTPDDAEFSGWLVGTSRFQVDDNYVVTDNVTVEAQWTQPEPEFTVTYDFNGGTRNGESTYVTKSVAFAPDIVPENFRGIDGVEIVAPEGMELAAIQINGARYEFGTSYLLNCDTTFKYEWQPIDGEGGGSSGEEPPAEKITQLNIGIAIPKAGDVAKSSTYPDITLDENPDYILDHVAYITAYPSEMPEGYDEQFVGTFEAGKTYVVEVSLRANGGHNFIDNGHMYLAVNGKTSGYEMGQYNADGSVYYLFYAKITVPAEGDEENDDEDETIYVLGVDDVVISFNDDSNKDYDIEMTELTELENATDEELARLGGTREELKEVLDTIKEATKEEGTMIKVYQISVSENGNEVHEVNGGFNITIDYTEDMAGYNTFKLVYVNDQFEAGEVITLTKSGNYLKGTIPHLSGYVLVGSNVAGNATNNAVDTVRPITNNPQTSDSILTFVIMLIVSTLGLFIGTYSLKRKYSK